MATPPNGTPNVAKCLGDAVKQGRITQANADDALKRVRDLLDRNPLLTEGQVASTAAEAIQAAALLKRQQTALQIIATDRALQNQASHPDGEYAGAAAVLARDISGKATYSNVEGRTAAVRGILHAKIADVLDTYRSTALGLRRDVIGLTRLVKEMYGEATGDGLAATAARGWKDATNYAAGRFNAAGGTILRKEAWLLPQDFWDADAMKAAGRPAWTDWMHGELASGRLRIMHDDGAPVDAARAAEIISNAYDRISTRGLSDLVPGQGGATKLGNSRSERRVFEWATSEAWLGANNRWGKGDEGIWDILTGHIDGMARDIGALEVLGPNPDGAVRVLIDTAKKAGATNWQVYQLEARWDHVTGAASSPVHEGAAGLLAGVRSWLSSAQLGSATLTSVTDFSTLRATAAWNGLGANGVMGRYLELLNPANAGDRLQAVRSGLIADGWAKRAMAANRTMLEEVGQTLPGRMADFVMRASGQNAHTQAAKWAFGMEFLGTLAERAGQRFDALDPAMRRSFERYGLGASEWDLIRTKGLTQADEGVAWIHPEKMTREGGRPEMEAATRLLEMIDAERGFAVVEPGVAEQSLILGRSRPGTLEGELLRASAQYKSFPVTMMTRHLMRGLGEIRAGDHGRYLVSLAVSLTVMGATAMQLKSLATGRDPRDMADPGFWAAAFMQGGGAGILGDFLNSALTRSDRSFYMTAIGGPTGGLVDDLMKLTGANITASVEGKDAHFGREMARFVRNNTPGTSLWYSRLAVDRLMWDRLQQLTDPDAGRAFQRTQDRARQEHDQQFWWRPGEGGPGRGPDLGAVVGGSQ